MLSSHLPADRDLRRSPQAPKERIAVTPPALRGAWLGRGGTRPPFDGLPTRLYTLIAVVAVNCAVPERIGSACSGVNVRRPENLS